MIEQLKRYEAWEELDGARSISFSTTEGIEIEKKNGLLSKNAKLIHVITAATFEEAKSIYNLRMGFAPYRPQGEPRECPNICGAFFYPESSDECPYCGKVC